MRQGLHGPRAADAGGGDAGARGFDRRVQHSAESSGGLAADERSAIFFVVAERYPQLKADQNFQALQNRISELEERIADRREFFNDDVNTYNTRIAQLPEVFLAWLMKLQPRQMFRVNEQERQQVEVKPLLARGQGTS